MSGDQRPRIVVADDHRMVGDALRSVLADAFDVVRVVADGIELIEAARELRPDGIVVDISMPRLGGIDALAELHREKIDAPVVVLTMHRETAYAVRALNEGARGYVLKHAAAQELVIALQTVLAGGTYLTPSIAGDVLAALRGGATASDPVASLTPRQREVLHLLADGLSAKEIGTTLGMSPRTVETHKYQMMERLGLSSTAKLIRFAVRHGIVDR